jgi:hypothetical protein
MAAVEAIAAALVSNDCLQTLILNDNPLGAGGAHALFLALKHNRALSRLLLDNCGLGAASMAALPGCLADNTGLTVLSLDNNWLADPESVCCIADAIVANGALAHLFLRHVGFGGLQEHDPGWVDDQALRVVLTAWETRNARHRRGLAGALHLTGPVERPPSTPDHLRRFLDHAQSSDPVVHAAARGNSADLAAELSAASVRGATPGTTGVAGVAAITARQAARLVACSRTCVRLLDITRRSAELPARCERMAALMTRLRAAAATNECAWCLEQAPAPAPLTPPTALTALTLLSCGHRVCRLCLDDLADMARAAAGATSQTCPACGGGPTCAPPPSLPELADPAATTGAATAAATGPAASMDMEDPSGQPPALSVLDRLAQRMARMAGTVVELEDIGAAVRERRVTLVAEIDLQLQGDPRRDTLCLQATSMLDADLKALMLQRETLETRLLGMVDLFEQPPSAARIRLAAAKLAEPLCLVPVAENTLHFLLPHHLCRLPIGE